MKRKQVFMALTLLLLTAALSSCNWTKETWRSITGSKTTEVCTDTAKTIEYTAYDVVAQRRAEIQEKKMDSAYYAIPEPVLIAIVEQIGVGVYREDIVNTYLKNKQYYDGLMNGVINKKYFMPDSIPNKPVVDIPTKVLPTDSIRK